MAACPRCGYGNPGGADHCANPDCRADFGWATPVHPEPVRAEQGQRRGVRLTLDPAELAVDPRAVATATLTVRNTGTRVEEFELAVRGPGGSFATVEPWTLSVFPDDEATAVVRFAPERGTRHPAGRAPFHAEARSRVHHDTADVARGAVVVGPFDQLQATLDPETSRGRSHGVHRVTLTNQGNRPADVHVGLGDRDGELSFDPPQFSATLRPGEHRPQQVQVGGRRRWFGRAESRPFSAVVTPAGPQQPITLNGNRRQLAVFPWWIPMLALALVAVAIAVYALLPGAGPVPAVGGLTEAAAVERLQDAGYEADVSEKAHPEIAAGLAIETVPRAGIPLAGGERVQLFVSNGPCEDACPVQVPDVVGLPVAEARGVLAAAGFPVDRVIEVQNPTFAAGTVIESRPPPLTEQPLGSPVVLTASTGPSPEGGKVLVLPDVIGDQEPDAVQVLESRDLVVAIQRARTADPPAGEVLDSDPPPGTEVEAGSTVTLVVSRPPTDLITAAADAEWRDGDGPISFAAQTLVADAFVRVDVNILPGDPATRVLVTGPDPEDGGFITGVYPLQEPIAATDRLRGEVRGLTGGVEIVVTADGREVETVTAEIISLDGEQSLDVDLSGVAGATTLELTVRAGDDPTRSVVGWRELRIEGEVR